jgi:hypothetical protein
MAKTDEDKAHDLIVKAMGMRGVNFPILCDKLWNGPEWQTEQIWTFMLAYFQAADIHARYPDEMRMTPTQKENARKLSGLYTLGR